MKINALTSNMRPPSPKAFQRLFKGRKERVDDGCLILQNMKTNLTLFSESEFLFLFFHRMGCNHRATEWKVQRESKDTNEEAFS